MRLMVLNPNTSPGITARLMGAAEAAAAPDTALEGLTAPRGVPYIATRAEAAIGAAVALEMLAEHVERFDAAVIAAFGDPGLGGARELFDQPVVGLAEAGMLTACMLGGRFAIVSFARSLEPWYAECVAWHGLGERCCAIRCLETGFTSIDDVQEEHRDLLIDLAERAVVENGADVVVLAGAPLAGLADQVRDYLSVPAVDCMAAAVKQAELLVALAPRKAVAGSFRRPAAKPSTGLPRSLANRLGHR